MDPGLRKASGLSSLTVSSTKSFAPLLIDESQSTRKRKKSMRRCASFGSKVRSLRSKEAWVEAAIEAVQDLINLKWLMVIGWLFVLSWLTGLAILLSNVIDQALFNASSEASACQPDGSFNIIMNQYNWWGASGFFQITMAWGEMTFANAKIVDVGWDVIFSRGGQALIAWISWNVFSDYVTTSIQVSPVTYETFWTIYLQETPNFYSTWYLLRDFTRSHGLRSRVAMTFMVIVAIFILVFPTLGSAMSGYQANSGAFVNGIDGEMLKFSDFHMIAYVIHDGDRLNLTKDYPVTFLRTNSEQLIRESGSDYVPYTSYSSYYGYGGYTSRFAYCINPPYSENADRMRDWEKQYPMNQRCIMHGNVSDYVQQHGFFGLKNEKSTWMNKTIEAPTLDISAYFLPEKYDALYGNNWTDPRTGTEPFSDKTKVAYSYKLGNGTYGLDYIKANGSCQPVTELDNLNSSVRETYQWGFSYIQLFIMLILLMLWTIGMSVMWIKAHMTMRMRGRFDKPKGFKGVLELAAAIRKELQETNPDDLSHDQLSEEIRKRLKGGSIELESAGSPAMYGILKGFWGWIKERRWWVAAWCLLVIFGSMLATYEEGTYSWVLVFMSSTLVAMVVGGSPRSRAMLCLWGSIIGMSVWVAVISSIMQRHKYGSFGEYM